MTFRSFCLPLGLVAALAAWGCSCPCKDKCGLDVEHPGLDARTESGADSPGSPDGAPVEDRAGPGDQAADGAVDVAGMDIPDALHDGADPVDGHTDGLLAADQENDGAAGADGTANMQDQLDDPASADVGNDADIAVPDAQPDVPQWPPAIEVMFLPTPEEDKNKGLNSNVYLSAIGHPAPDEQDGFVEAIHPIAVAMRKTYGVPACAIGGMAIVEAGYGFTRTGWLANNLFGLKYWNQSNPSGAGTGIELYQLRGQPDEAWDGSVKVLVSYGPDKKIFDEDPRYDNRYPVFPNYDACVEYLVVDRFMGKTLYPFVLQYQQRLKEGWTIKDAAIQFLFEIAAPPAPGLIYDPNGNDEYYLVTHVNDKGKVVYGGGGYNQNGGTYYSKVIGSAMKEWGLYAWDKE
ncbi:MAG: hypothetical protein FJ109_16980 [Deltaproteobacteria bacterium]|nr:hypothetical protein [Deltaproteobacteria bacterium]